MITGLGDFKVYNLAMDIGEDIWEEVSKWDYFAKQAIGLQLVKAVDSIAANLSEGLGRCHFKETKNFSYFSRGSFFETRTWLTKANNRKLISDEKYRQLIQTIDIIGKMINSYIRSIGSVSEPEAIYQTPHT